MKRRQRRRGNRGPGMGRGPCPGLAGHPRVLSECEEGDCGTIVTNGDLQSMEMGLFLGAGVEVLKNHPREANLVVAVGPARYAVARTTAELIFIK